MKKLSPAANNAATAVSGDTSASTAATQLQKENFEAGMKLFHARDFARALPLFDQAGRGPNRDVSHVSRQHANICRQRVSEEHPDLHTADDYYHHGLDLLSQRRLPDAEHALSQALDLSPHADHVLYSLCLCRGLRGDLKGAVSFLERAVAINAKNRTLARTDADFLEFGRQSPLREMVFGERRPPRPAE